MDRVSAGIDSVLPALSWLQALHVPQHVTLLNKVTPVPDNLMTRFPSHGRPWRCGRRSASYAGELLATCTTLVDVCHKQRRRESPT